MVDYLLEQGLISRSTLVRGEVTVQLASRRNHNFAVRVVPGASYFIKQGVDAGTTQTLEHEADFYQLLHAQSGRSPLCARVPRLVHFDASRSILVIELISGARDLSDFRRSSRAPNITITRQLGKSLAALHQLPASRMPTRVAVPTVFRFSDLQLSDLRELSAGSLELFALAQRFEGYNRHLRELGQEWGARAVVHGDVRGENCLIQSNSKPRQPKRLWLIDWELAGMGDPGWDIGSVFADYLADWTTSIPIADGLPVESMPMLARRPLNSIQPALRAFWSAYNSSVQTDDRSTREDLLMRSTRFAAARLSQYAFEQSQLTSEVSGTAVCLMQLAWNMLRRPSDAIIWLLGLRGPTGRAAA